MKNDLQNRINDAISRGVKLGLELYDDEIQDISLDKDLLSLLQLKNFNVFEPFKNIDKYVEDFFNGGTIYLWLFKELCCNYRDEYYGVYTIKDDAIFLYELINRLCNKFGNTINLNWIVVSKLTIMHFQKIIKPVIGPPFPMDVGVFSNCGDDGLSKSEFNGDISKWDVSNAQDMSYMFVGTKFNGDISKWDVSNVCVMSYMFEGSQFNGDISKWDVSNVENMEMMFANSAFNGDISTWDVRRVKNICGMFCRSKFNGDISKWDVSNVENMESLFQRSQFDGDISRWDVSNVKNMASMFQDSKFNRDISRWDVSNVKNMASMFYNSKFNRDISNWNIKYPNRWLGAFMWDLGSKIKPIIHISRENLPKKILKYL